MTKHITQKQLSEKREAVGLLLRQIREERGLTQQELADALGVQQFTISKIEKGKFGITIDYLHKIGHVLHFKVELKTEKNV